MLDRRTRRVTLAAGAAVAALAGTVALSATPASAATTGKIAPASCFYVEEYHVTTNGLRIHQYPSTGSAGGAVFGLAYYGQEVISRRGLVYAAGLWWVYGTDENTGVTGWMAREYLYDNGDIGTCL